MKNKLAIRTKRLGRETKLLGDAFRFAGVQISDFISSYRTFQHLKVFRHYPIEWRNWEGGGFPKWIGKPWSRIEITFEASRHYRFDILVLLFDLEFVGEKFSESVLYYARRPWNKLYKMASAIDRWYCNFVRIFIKLGLIQKPVGVALGRFEVWKYFTLKCKESKH